MCAQERLEAEREQPVSETEREQQLLRWMVDSDDEDGPAPPWNPLWPPPGGASPPLKPPKTGTGAEEAGAGAGEQAAEAAAAAIGVDSSVTLNEMREAFREADMDAEVRLMRPELPALNYSLRFHSDSCPRHHPSRSSGEERKGKLRCCSGRERIARQGSAWRRRWKESRSHGRDGFPQTDETILAWPPYRFLSSLVFDAVATPLYQLGSQ